MLDEFQFTCDPYLRGTPDPFTPGAHLITLKTFQPAIESHCFDRIYAEILSKLPNYKVGVDYYERSINFLHTFYPQSRLPEKYKSREIFEDWFETSELWRFIRARRLKRPDHENELVEFANSHPTFIRKFRPVLEHAKFKFMLEYKMGWYEYELSTLMEVEVFKKSLQDTLDKILANKK